MAEAYGNLTREVLRLEKHRSEDTLRNLRGYCVQNVKKTNGSVTLDKAVEFQKGGV